MVVKGGKRKREEPKKKKTAAAAAKKEEEPKSKKAKAAASKAGDKKKTAAAPKAEGDEGGLGVFMNFRVWKADESSDPLASNPECVKVKDWRHKLQKAFLGDSMPAESASFGFFFFFGERRKV